VLVAYHKLEANQADYPYPRTRAVFASPITLSPGHYFLSLSHVRGGVVYVGAGSYIAPLFTRYGRTVDVNLYQRQPSGELEAKVSWNILSAALLRTANFTIDTSAQFTCRGMHTPI
jgi:hypothetical protein